MVISNNDPIYCEKCDSRSLIVIIHKQQFNKKRQKWKLKITRWSKKFKTLVCQVWWVLKEMGDKMAPEETQVAPVKGPQCDYAASGPLKQRDSSSRTRVPSEVGLTTSDKKRRGLCVWSVLGFA